MPEINFVPAVTIPRVPNIVIPKTTIPQTPHVTRTLAPVFEMSCTTIRRDGTKNSQLFIDDPAGNSYICALPFYEPLQYNKKDLILIEDAKPPTNTQPEIPETETPKTPDLPKKDPECPDPKKNNPRIGDLNTAGTEKVVGFMYVEETKECLVLYSPTTKVEKYLPSLNTVSTTFAITVVATISATVAAPFLNRVLKPAFKQLIAKIKKRFKKKDKTV